MTEKDRSLYLALAHEVWRAYDMGNDATLPMQELRGHLYRATDRGSRWIMPSGQKTSDPRTATVAWTLLAKRSL